jgi:uroporphyrinogen-III synthase
LIEPPAMGHLSEPLSLRDPESGRPLRVLITRPADQAGATAELVQQAGGEALVCPCLVLAPPDPSLAARFAASLLQAQTPGGGQPILAVTSRYAVQALADALASQSPSQTLHQALAGVPLAAVGPRTAQALADHGCAADYVAGGLGGPEGSDESSAAQLAAELIADHAARPDSARPAVLFLRAAEARPTLPQALRSAGFAVHEVEAYRMQPARPESLSPLRQALAAGRVDLAPFGSPRSVAIALSALGEQAAPLFAATHVGAIGQTTAQALREAGIRVDAVAPQARFSALLSALVALRRKPTVLT